MPRAGYRYGGKSVISRLTDEVGGLWKFRGAGDWRDGRGRVVRLLCTCDGGDCNCAGTYVLYEADQCPKRVLVGAPAMGHDKYPG